MNTLIPEVLKIDDDVHLRVAKLHDAKEQHRVLQENRAFLGEFLELDSEADIKLQDVVRERVKIQEAMQSLRFLDYWIINGGSIVGNVSMNRREPGTAMIGYWLAEDAQMQGFATRTTRRIISHGAHNLGVDTAEFWIEPTNTASQQVARRLGAEIEYTAELPGIFDIWSVETRV